MAASTTCARNSSSVREASSGENSTSAQRVSCERHAFDRLLDNLLLRHVEFVFAMNGAGGEEDVDEWTGGILQRAPCGLDVFAIAPREAGDDRAMLPRERPDSPTPNRRARRLGNRLR